MLYLNLQLTLPHHKYFCISPSTKRGYCWITRSWLYYTHSEDPKTRKKRKLKQNIQSFRSQWTQFYVKEILIVEHLKLLKLCKSTHIHSMGAWSADSKQK
jgi:hypothetical protein